MFPLIQSGRQLLGLPVADLAVWLIIICGVVAIGLVALKEFGMTPPQWLIRIVVIVVVALVAILAIRFLTTM